MATKHKCLHCMWQDTVDSLDMIVLSVKMFWSFAAIFGVYEFGERLSESFDEINDVYDQSTWYAFPCNVQNMLTILLLVAQKPVELRVFGSTSCSRITFKNVREISCAPQKSTQLMFILMFVFI